jgi:hypothetical protein
MAILPVRIAQSISRRRAAGRAVPITWLLVVAEAALATRRHWQQVEPTTRRRLRELVAKSRGRPSNLTAAERSELRRLVDRLDLRVLVRDLTALASPIGLPRLKRRSQ